MLKVVTLTNGKRVGNFSSAHSFTFEDGTVLPACSMEHAHKYKVHFIENVLENGDIELTFDLSRGVMVEMTKWLDKQLAGEVDVVYCPLPMIQAIREVYGKVWLLRSPFRAIRRANDDRTQNIISISKQCI